MPHCSAEHSCRHIYSSGAAGIWVTCLPDGAPGVEVLLGGKRDQLSSDAGASSCGAGSSLTGVSSTELIEEARVSQLRWHYRLQRLEQSRGCSAPEALVLVCAGWSSLPKVRFLGVRARTTA
eukprot:2540154-Rhodomonas_salina.1